MPQTVLTSAKSVINKVIRNTGYKLPSMYHDDLLEWIPEGIGMLQVTRSLERKSTGNADTPGQLLVKNHCVKLPCGFISILALEDVNGRRIPEGGDVTNLSDPTSFAHSGLAPSDDSTRSTVFNVNPLLHQTSDGTPTTEPGTGVPIYGQDLEKTTGTGANPGYYIISGNYLQLSFEEGFVKLHYESLPVCSEGYPLIPNNENFKAALYWYVVMMLIGAGYEHKVFRFGDAEERFEKYAARAMAEISYPSPDSAERVYNSTTRLIPPHHFYEDFFVGSEQSERLNK